MFDLNVVIAQLEKRSAPDERSGDCLVHESESYPSFLSFFFFNYFYFAHGPCMLHILFKYMYILLDIIMASLTFYTGTCFQRFCLHISFARIVSTWKSFKLK